MTSPNETIRPVSNEARSDTVTAEATAQAPLERAPSHDELYEDAATPPAYTQTSTEGEVSVDAEATQVEKPERSPLRPSQPATALQLQTTNPISLEAREAVTSPTSPTSPSIQRRPVPAEQPSQQSTPLLGRSAISETPALYHYLTEPIATTDLIGTRACSILQNRAATWLLKRTNIALCPLAAAILLSEGLIREKDLSLVSQHGSSRRDPTDPISGALLGCYDTVNEIFLGLLAGPIEMGRQASPLLRDREENSISPGRAAAKVGIETGKGFARTITTSFKAPAVIAHDITRGFHNLPKAYGEPVRVFENVTDVKSGFVVGLKSFGYGIGDGIRDLAVKPMEGAEKHGVVGFIPGVAKGICNGAFKPAAGSMGLIGYPMLGIYKQIRSAAMPNKEGEGNQLVLGIGEKEYLQATETDKYYVVRRWCQIRAVLV